MGHRLLPSAPALYHADAKEPFPNIERGSVVEIES